ncbi:T9SS type A sorting domain-containing protein [Flavobacterium sp. SM15]|uniref:type IX secretion system anionic LPS delivery protein PorZ n=1 Tax=Flavobacterium sp. SM15 TaxID=2908005 RepID=UPI001EDC7A08|nr:T9SS type A sorting domain-containing protein [Flavobacterium sp. SM15]MCG2612265.1 T9SS type A sorting domain-containing protein [Flavobacterium sp. SM15]
MKKVFFCTLFFITLIGFSQQNQLWKGYFSYTNINDVSDSPTTVYAGAENAVFSKNSTTNEIKTINSIDGLKADVITCIYKSNSTGKLLIGNQNGLLLVVNEADKSVLNVLDIVNKPSIPPNIKKINHIYEYNGKAYLSCDFGICIFDLATLQFGDTYIIGPSGEYVQVFQTTVYNDELYAVTRYNGIRKGALSNPNLVSYAQWQVFDSGNWNGIATIGNQLVASNTNLNLYRWTGTNFAQFSTVSQAVEDFRVAGDKLVFTSPNHVYTFNAQLVQQQHITQIPGVASTFTSATIISDEIFIGTKDKGLYSTTTGNVSVFEDNTPNGPYMNNIFRIKKTSNFLWADYGSYSDEYNPYNPFLGEFPISKYAQDSGWTLLPYENLLQAKSLTTIVPNPRNDKQVFVSSFHSGLLKIDNQNISLYNNLNTGPNGLERVDDPNPNYVSIRVNGPAFDKEGNLWMTNSLVKKAIKVFRADGQWQSYSLEGITPSPQIDNYAITVIDKNGTKWIPSFRSGVIGFNEKFNNKFNLIKYGEEGNLPEKDIRSLAIDTKNQLWIGTASGLRILTSVDKFLTDETLKTNSIIIMEDGLAQELFFQQSIMDIAVDGANRKWLSIADGGVFLVSPNGQETIYHFTKENSPLPSNNINDIEIDGVTGEVFFATDKGLVSFMGISTKGAEDLSNVYAYPNPVRPGYVGTVKISGLIDNANVKITDIEGNLVHETTSKGGTIEWDTTAFGKHRVASGVYMVLIAGEDGTETKVTKVMIIR